MRHVLRYIALALTKDQFDEWPADRKRAYLEDHPHSSFVKQRPEIKDRKHNLGPKAQPQRRLQRSPIHSVPDKTRVKVLNLLDRLKTMTDEAKAEGKDAPNYDLCDVSIPGTNLFCEGNLGVPREKMPQLKGTPVKGSPAAKLDAKGGEVSAEQAFIEHLKESGVDMRSKPIDASRLRATQSQLVGSKVAGMLAALKKDPNNKAIRAPIFVSRDGYILDGHHRWAAVVGLAMENDEPVHMDTIVVDMSAKDLVKRCNSFATKFGIEQKGL